MGLATSCCKNTDDDDNGDAPTKRACIVAKALSERAEFHRKKLSRVEYIIQLDHLTTEEKEQIVKIESRRSRAERLSPREPRDLTFYHQVTFHVPDDLEDTDPTQSGASNDCCLSTNGTAGATTSPAMRGRSDSHNQQPPHGQSYQQRGSMTSHLQDDAADATTTDGGSGWSLAVFGTLHTGDGGGDTTAAGILGDSGSGNPQRCLRVSMDASMSMSRSLNSATKKKSVSFPTLFEDDEGS